MEVAVALGLAWTVRETHASPVSVNRKARPLWLSPSDASAASIQP